MDILEVHHCATKIGGVKGRIVRFQILSERIESECIGWSVMVVAGQGLDSGSGMRIMDAVASNVLGD